MPANQHQLYLTFDDGPHPVITPWVLQQLEQYNAKATFFCVGDNVRKYPAVAENIRQQGHSLGNHTFNHLKGWNTEDAEYLSNIRRCNDVLPTRLFRPPYGRLGRNQARLIRDEGYTIVMWSLLSCDYDPALNPGQSLQKLIRHARPGSIIVFHDSEKARKNLEFILPRFLETMTGKGYTFAAI